MQAKIDEVPRENRPSRSADNLKANIDSKDTNVTEKKKETKNLGSYILGKDLGEGTFGKVKLATNVQTNEKVAIKILDKTKIIEDSDDIKRLEREICILKKMRHKNIIQLYEIMESRKNLYLVMEYCEERELFDYIVSKKRLTEMEACKFYQEIIDGIEYLHIQNIVHRDLKPENLLLDYKKSIKLSDFGLSAIYSSDTLLKTPCGTPSYAPPEMLKGRKYHGLLSDIWSSGIILFAMVCGYLPFSESKEEMVIRKIVQGVFEIPNHVSPLLKDFLKNVLKHDPIERYDLDQIKQHPWFNIHKPNFCPGLIIGYHNIPIDENILQLIEEYGYDKEKARNAIVSNKFDTMVAIYYLCLKRYVKEGNKSISDMFSNRYLEYMMDTKSVRPEILEAHLEKSSSKVSHNLEEEKEESKGSLKKKNGNKEKENKIIKEKATDLPLKTRESITVEENEENANKYKRAKKKESTRNISGQETENLKTEVTKIVENAKSANDQKRDTTPKPNTSSNSNLQDQQGVDTRNKFRKDSKKEKEAPSTLNDKNNEIENQEQKGKNYDLPFASKHSRRASISSGNNNLDLNFFKAVTTKDKDKKVVVLKKDSSDVASLGSNNKDSNKALNENENVKLLTEATVTNKKESESKLKETKEKVDTKDTKDMKKTKDANKTRDDRESNSTPLPPESKLSTQKETPAKEYNMPLKTDYPTSRAPKKAPDSIEVNETLDDKERERQNKVKNLPLKIIATSKVSTEKQELQEKKNNAKVSKQSNSIDKTNTHISSTEAFIENCRKQNDEIAKLLKESVQPVLNLKSGGHNHFDVTKLKSLNINAELTRNLLKNHEFVQKGNKNTLSSILKQNLNQNSVQKCIQKEASHHRSSSHNDTSIRNSNILEPSGAKTQAKHSRKTSDVMGTTDLSFIAGILEVKIKENSERKHDISRVLNTENSLMRKKLNNPENDRSRYNVTEVYSRPDKSYSKNYSNNRDLKKKFLNISTGLEGAPDGHHHEREHTLESSVERSVSNSYATNSQKTKQKRQLSFSPNNAIKNLYKKEEKDQKAKLDAILKLKKQKKLTPNRFKQTSKNAANYSFNNLNQTCRVSKTGNSANNHNTPGVSNAYNINYVNNYKLVSKEKNLSSCTNRESSLLKKRETADTKTTTDILTDNEEYITPSNKIHQTRSDFESIQTRNPHQNHNSYQSNASKVKSNVNKYDSLSTRLKNSGSTDRQNYKKVVNNSVRKNSDENSITDGFYGVENPRSNSNTRGVSSKGKPTANSSSKPKQIESIDTDNKDITYVNQLAFAEYDSNYNFPLQKLSKGGYQSNDHNMNYKPKINPNLRDEICPNKRIFHRKNQSTDLANNTSCHQANNNSFFNTTNYNTTIIINNASTTKNGDLLEQGAQQRNKNFNILKTEVSNSTRNQNTQMKIQNDKSNGDVLKTIEDMNSNLIKELKEMTNYNPATVIKGVDSRDQRTQRSEAMKNNYLFKKNNDKSSMDNSVLHTLGNMNGESKSNKVSTKNINLNEKIRSNLANENHNKLDEFFVSTTTPSNKSEQYSSSVESMKIYNGPVDLTCLISSTLKGSIVIDKIVSYLKKKNLTLVQIHNYKYKCMINSNNQIQLNLDFELFKLDSESSYIKFRNHQGDFSFYRKVCNSILNQIAQLRK